MEIIKTLEQIGLSGKMAEVYLSSLELGSSSNIEIAKETGIKRTTCYDILIDLVKQGIMTETRKAKKRLFVAEDPEKILKDLKEKERNFSEILPQLKSIHNIKGGKPKIRFYEGKNGMLEVLKDTLNYKNPILAFASDPIFNLLGKAEVERYWKKRRLKNINVKGIMPRTETIINNIVRYNIRDLRETKLIDPKKYPFTIEINIYGTQKVALMSWIEKVAVIIEGKEIHNTMKSIFELIWNILPEENLN